MARRKEQPGPDIFTRVDDATYDELTLLTGQRVVHVELWEDSLVDELLTDQSEVDGAPLFDLDLYLEEGIFFELYGASAFTGLEADPIVDNDELARTLLTLVNEQIWLDDVAVDEDENLVLVLGQTAVARLYLVIGGWSLEEWEELPAGE